MMHIKYIASLAASLGLIAANLSFAPSAKAGIIDSITNPFGRCGVPGEATVSVVNHLRTKVYVAVEKEGKLSGTVGQELNPNQSFKTGICNRDGFRTKVYTPENCGKTFLAESRYSRVYNKETVQLTPEGFKFDVADILNVGSAVGGFALTYIGAYYGVPPKALAAMGVREAEVTAICSKDGAANCGAAIYKYLPSDLLTTIKADKCLSKAFAQANGNAPAPSSTSVSTIAFKNNCSHPLQVAVRFQNTSGQWETRNWYSFAPSESARLNGVETRNRYVYYYAQTTDGSNIAWNGNDTRVTVGNTTYDMKMIDLGSQITKWTQSLSCNQAMKPNGEGISLASQS